ncbi:MAG: hypothetical protein COV66_15465 [Nitrospinae bacterium CG11_big_fil_rev_8_21_14_0_20_45_15]|nr:MAG: hypothetical protein COV66_15465 [Nitrospinae bacterium CG11_big_fil_rev_8_21_14_0_20_45_15]
MNNCFAAIFIPPSFDLSLLDKKVAGIPLLKRLILTLNRVGFEHIVLFGSKKKLEDCDHLNKELATDHRFKGDLIRLEEGHYFSQLEILKDKHCLAINANTIVLKETISSFFQTSQASESFKTNHVVQMAGERHERLPLFLLPLECLSALDSWNQSGNPPVNISLIPADSDAPIFVSSVQNRSELKQAERTFIAKHRFHYSQLMDIWFNSFFALRISSLLVKTPFTPNQITLAGLLIGLLASYGFAQGNYWGGLIGSLLLAFTAVWDCCDGDVARLKFMESDFGEKLDTACDNVINVFVFTGIMLGVAKVDGWNQALLPFAMLCLGGGGIFILIYFPKGGKGAFFKGTSIYSAIQLLASRNFVYIVLLFGIVGELDWFLWFAGFGSLLFALELFRIRLKTLALRKTQQELP